MAAEHEEEELLAKCRALSQRIAIFSNRMIGESDAIAVEVKSLQQSIATAEKAAKRAAGPDSDRVLQVLRSSRDVIEGLGPGGDMRRFCKPKNPLMLRLVLGEKVSVVAVRADQMVAMKEEYYRFRDMSSYVMFAWPGLLMLGMRRASRLRDSNAEGTHTFTPGLMTGVQGYLLWLSYFYLAMAMRENVLMVNGSHIKAWWIQHHYWSAGAAVCMLGLPVYSPAVYMFCEWFMMWSCLQALVMMVQNRYQKRRMYTRIALGKNSAMDVVSGESSGSSGQLLLLYPLLFVLQAVQLMIGVGVAYRTYPSFLRQEGWLDPEEAQLDLRGMRGVFLIGCSFAYMGLRNFLATVESIIQKRRYAKKARAKVAKST